MKKTWIMIIAVILTVIIVGIIFGINLAKKEESFIIKVNTEELKQKLEQKETFILLVSKENCSYCKEYAPILNRVLKEYKLNAYEVDWKELRNDTDLSKTYSISGTPTTIFIHDGEENTTINRIVGTTTYNKVKEKLKERGFIKG